MAATPPSTFGSLLRGYRSEAGLTQEELAEQAGLSVRAISDLERGVNISPRPFTVRRLADALDLTAAHRSAFRREAMAAPAVHRLARRRPRRTFPRVSSRV